MYIGVCGSAVVLLSSFLAWRLLLFFFFFFFCFFCRLFFGCFIVKVIAPVSGKRRTFLRSLFVLYCILFYCILLQRDGTGHDSSHPTDNSTGTSGQYFSSRSMAMIGVFNRRWSTEGETVQQETYIIKIKNILQYIIIVLSSILRSIHPLNSVFWKFNVFLNFLPGEIV